MALAVGAWNVLSSNDRAVADDDQCVLTIVFSQSLHAAWLSAK